MRDCPKCAGGMIEGFVVDHTHGGSGVSSWVEGAPKKSFWLGLNLRGKTPLPIVSCRCRRCGYLESYAPRQ